MFVCVRCFSTFDDLRESRVSLMPKFVTRRIQGGTKREKEIQSKKRERNKKQRYEYQMEWIRNSKEFILHLQPNDENVETTETSITCFIQWKN